MNENAMDQLINQVLLKNFFNQNKFYIKLRILNTSEIEMLLKKNNLIIEALIFKREKINGLGFIFLLTKEEGLEIIKREMRLSSQSIEKLKDLYKKIVEFRFHFCKDFDEDEIPSIDQLLFWKQKTKNKKEGTTSLFYLFIYLLKMYFYLKKKKITVKFFLFFIL